MKEKKYRTGKIYYPVWMHLIVDLQHFNLYEHAITLQMTYSHLLKIVREFEDRGWIKIVKQGRSNTFFMTEEGSEIQKFIKKVMIRTALVSDFGVN